MNKDIKRIVQAAVARGWRLSRGGKHHFLLSPQGRKVTFSCSPSCPHVHKRISRDIDRVEQEEGDAAADREDAL